MGFGVDWIRTLVSKVTESPNWPIIHYWDQRASGPEKAHLTAVPTPRMDLDAFIHKHIFFWRLQMKA